MYISTYFTMLITNILKTLESSNSTDELKAHINESVSHLEKEDQNYQSSNLHLFRSEIDYS